MATYYKYLNFPQVVKVSEIKPTAFNSPLYKWEVFCLNGEYSSLSFNTYPFHPSGAVVCPESEFLNMKDAVLEELNLFVLPIHKVCKTPIEL
jgi:hypothetical protein